ncbi:MAG: hypothetical protein COT74_00190 [Bdellovibrionales bacterium CG10_big_fil_rev_8_21_14_0_10_45_34]|nr:MAG: hypothetical protein COT74_00190 [Bdellovibrionales bacterium CG10_big_fil_rev_8_21_14_0_10_45_34]
MSFNGGKQKVGCQAVAQGGGGEAFIKNIKDTFAWLCAVMSLLMLVAVAADAQSQRVLNIGKGEQSTVARLRNSKTVPIYETQTYTTTCTDTVLAGHRQECQVVREQCRTENVCPNRRGAQCRQERVCTGGHRECRSVPYYETVYYSCERTRTVVVGYETVKETSTDIAVRVASDSSRALSGQEKLLIVVDDDAELKVKGEGLDGANLVEIKRNLKTDYTSSISNIISGEILVDIIDAAPLKQKMNLSMGQIERRGATVSFIVKDDLDLSTFRVHLEFEEDKFLANKVLFDGILSEQHLKLQATAGGTLVSIDLSKLSLRHSLDRSKRHRIELRLELDRDVAEYLNSESDVKSINVEKVIKTKLN